MFQVSSFKFMSTSLRFYNKRIQENNSTHFIKMMAVDTSCWVVNGVSVDWGFGVCQLTGWFVLFQLTRWFVMYGWFGMFQWIWMVWGVSMDNVVRDVSMGWMINCVLNRRSQRHSKHKTEKHKRSTLEVMPWNGQ